MENHKFLCHENSVLIDDVYINKITLSKQVSFGKKDFNYFFGYKDNEKVKL